MDLDQRQDVGISPKRLSQLIEKSELFVAADWTEVQRGVTEGCSTRKCDGAIRSELILPGSATPPNAGSSPW